MRGVGRWRKRRVCVGERPWRAAEALRGMGGPWRMDVKAVTEDWEAGGWSGQGSRCRLGSTLRS